MVLSFALGSPTSEINPGFTVFLSTFSVKKTLKPKQKESDTNSALKPLKIKRPQDN